MRYDGVDRTHRGDVLERVLRQQHNFGRDSRLDRTIATEPAEPRRSRPRRSGGRLRSGPSLAREQFDLVVQPEARIGKASRAARVGPATIGTTALAARSVRQS